MRAWGSTGGDVNGEQECQSDGDGVGYDMTGCQMDGTMSGTQCDLKQVETQPLAGVKTG